jgi:hypothetical protein
MTRRLVALAAVLGGLGLVSGATAGNGVTVFVSPSRPGVGERIVVSLTNERATRILVPGGRDWCSFFTLERWSAAGWRAVRACPSAPDHLFVVAAGRSQNGVFASAGGPVVGRSGPPGVLTADLRLLPVIPLPKPGERPIPATEVPLGILPGGETPRVALAPARYRVTVRYWSGRATGPLLTARSRAFTVGG